MHNSVNANQVPLQAKTIAERVNQKTKDIKRGDGGKFAKKSAEGVVEPVSARESRKIQMTETEETRKRSTRKRVGPSTATITVTTPPISPRNVQKKAPTVDSGDETEAPIDIESTDFATAAKSNLEAATPNSAENVATANVNTGPTTEEIEEVLTRLRNEPVRASDYGKTEIVKPQNSVNGRPKRPV